MEGRQARHGDPAARGGAVVGVLEAEGEAVIVLAWILAGLAGGGLLGAHLIYAFDERYWRRRRQWRRESWEEGREERRHLGVWKYGYQPKPWRGRRP